MDASFVNAAYKNNTFPAADPWFAGKPANYYYYGHLMVGLYGHWLGVPPEYAYNLAAGTWPALTFILVFGIVFNLVGRSLPALIAAFLATMAGSVKSFIQIAVNLRLQGGPADPKDFREDYIPHDGLTGYFADAWEQLKAAFSLLPLVVGKGVDRLPGHMGPGLSQASPRRASEYPLRIRCLFLEAQPDHQEFGGL